MTTVCPVHADFAVTSLGRLINTASVGPNDRHPSRPATTLTAVRPHQILIVGSGDVAAALESISVTLGWDPAVVTTHDETTSRLPEAESVVVLSHDEKVDGPALAGALTLGMPYIGAMGSRRTQARRRSWLLANGVSEELADSIRGPAGLDIAADTPAEIAVAIVAEIIACRRGAVGADALSARPGPIHLHATPGSTECPGDGRPRRKPQ
ncbi:MAG: hypothetical protein GEU86_08395 [Actinophytocola sp.]|nr:hypothetical protein [Actinophytocola sp.]